MTGIGFLNHDIDLSTFLLLGVMSFLGSLLVHRKPTLRDRGKRIATGMFVLFTVILVFDRQPTDITAWVAILLRSLIFAGIVQGTVWMLLPAGLFAYENTFGLAFNAIETRSQAIKRRADEAQAERDRQLAAIREREEQEQAAIRRAQRERELETARQKREQEQEAARQKREQDERIRLEHEHEAEFYRLRDETVSLFLEHHVLLEEEELSVSAIVEDYEKQRPSIHDSWNHFLQFNQRWQYRVLIGAARKNIINDYSRVEPVIGSVLRRDQFDLLLKEALDRDGGSHDVDSCMERLDSLHEQLVTVFGIRIPDWQTNADAIRVESYAKIFAEADDDREEESPFDDTDDRLAHQDAVG